MSNSNGGQHVIDPSRKAIPTSVQISSCALCSSGFALQRDAQRHAANAEHEHTSVEVGVVFEPGSGVLSRCSSEGRHESKLIGPCLYLVPPGVRHETCWESPAEVFVAHVENAFWRETMGLAEPVFGAIPTARNDLIFWESATLLRHIWSELPLPRGQALLVAEFMLGRAALLSSSPDIAEVPTNAGLAPSKRHAMDAYIDRQIRFNLHATDLAKFVGLSVTQFALHLKHDTEMTPHEYITYRRMHRALQLLSTGDYCVTEVANAVGYDDSNHFSRIFRRFFNYAPREVIFRSRKTAVKCQGKP